MVSFYVQNKYKLFKALSAQGCLQKCRGSSQLVWTLRQLMVKAFGNRNET